MICLLVRRMNGTDSSGGGQMELNSIRQVLERAKAQSRQAHEEIEALLSELRSLKRPHDSSMGKNGRT